MVLCSLNCAVRPVDRAALRMPNGSGITSFLTLSWSDARGFAVPSANSACRVGGAVSRVYWGSSRDSKESAYYRDITVPRESVAPHTSPTGLS